MFYCINDILRVQKCLLVFLSKVIFLVKEVSFAVAYVRSNG